MYSGGGDQIVQDWILAQRTLRTVFRLYDLVCYAGVCCIIIRLLQYLTVRMLDWLDSFGHITKISLKS